MKKELEDLYANQLKLSNGRYKTTFLVVHHDDFGRDKTLRELEELLVTEETPKDWKINIIPISVTKEMKINCFVLEIESDELFDIDVEKGIYDYPHPLDLLEAIYYYDMIPIDWNPIIYNEVK